MNRRLVWQCLVFCVPAFGCVDMEKVPPRDAGVPIEEEDAGSEDAGWVDAGYVDAGLPTPDNTLFSIGITDNSGGVPQSAPLIALKFKNGIPGPGTVVARRLSTPIVIDGYASEWVGLPESIVPLQTRGGSIGMTQAQWDEEYLLLNGRTMTYDFGIPSVAVRAAYDDERIYFLLTWPDPTENRDRDTWFLDGGVFTRSRDNEDRAFLGFDINKSSPGFQAVGCAAACHLKERLGDVSDAGRAYRTRMHTAPGEFLDYWNWRAATTDPMGAADDGYIDETSRKFDGLADWIVTNQVLVVPDAGLPDGGRFDAGPSVAQPAFMGAMGINSNPWWLFGADAGNGKPLGIPFDPTGALPYARIPGFLMQKASPSRDDVSATGRHAGGYWTVEFSRALTTLDTKDTQFPLR